MNLTSLQKKWLYFGLFLLSLLFVFFLSRKVDVNTGVRSWSFDTQGVQHFRKGLDVSGGTRLTYKISYDKYEQIYKGTQLQQVKKNIENILFKQIDKRISSLGVADAKVYRQLMDGKTYINVDIGGVSDLEQAKNIIGKTIELEFRLPAPNDVSPEMYAKRKKLALSLHKEIIEHSESFAKLSENKGAEAVFYVHKTGITLDKMPPLLANKGEFIDNLGTGEVAPQLLSGVFTYNQVQNASGQVVLEPVEGFAIVKLNNKQIVDTITLLKKDIIALAEKIGLTPAEEEVKLNKIVEKKSYIEDNTYHWYNEVASKGSNMYKVKVAFIAPSLSGNDNGSIVKVVSEKIKTSDVLSGAVLLVDTKWKTEDDIKAVVPTFDPLKGTHTYEETNGKYVVHILDTKKANETLYEHMSIKKVPVNFIEQLMKKVVYDIEFTFVQNREPWILAQTANDKILNGAYFKYANASVSQLGESVVEINFNDEGKQVFCDITNENINKPMAIFIGGVLKTNPVIKSKICGGVAQISGGYTTDSAQALADELNNGALPAPLILLQEEKISPLLGENALHNALFAGMIGIFAIVFFVILSYGFKKSLVTLGVLTMFLAMLGLFMKITDYALSLSAIAAVILSVGMAVDANILIFERMREEEKEKSSTDVIDLSYDKSWSAIKDGNLSTGIIALLLFTMGNNIFKGFGFMLMVTVAITLLVNVPLTKILLHMLYPKNKNKDNNRNKNKNENKNKNSK